MADHLAEIQPQLDRCNKCGLCMAGCPTYRVTGLEWLVTRGRVSLVQDVRDGQLSVLETAPAIDTCLLCNACLAHCPPQVRIDQIVTRTRAEMRKSKPLPAPLRWLNRHLLPHYGRLRLAARLAAWGEAMGLRDRAAQAGWLRRWPALQRAHETGPRLPRTSARALLAREPLAPAGSPRARVASYVTCNREVLSPTAARAAVRLLVRAGCAVTPVEQGCCGLVAHSVGDLDAARNMARRGLDALERLAADAIVVDDASCAAHIKEWPRLLQGTADEERARAVADKLRDLATFLVDIGPPAFRAVPMRVTWHDPCSLYHHLGVKEAPRQLLRALPGATYVEAAEAGLCCGGAGSFMITQPELSDQILEIKLDALIATRADWVVTSSPSCNIQLERGLRSRGVPMRVTTLAEALAEALA